MKERQTDGLYPANIFHRKGRCGFTARTNFKDGIHSCKFVENYVSSASCSSEKYPITEFEYYVGTVRWVYIFRRESVSRIQEKKSSFLPMKFLLPFNK